MAGLSHYWSILIAVRRSIREGPVSVPSRSATGSTIPNPATSSPIIPPYLDCHRPTRPQY